MCSGKKDLKRVVNVDMIRFISFFFLTPSTKMRYDNKGKIIKGIGKIGLDFSPC